MTKHPHLKPRLLALIIALFLGASGTANLFAQTTLPEGALSHPFSVAEGSYVFFSQGDLQYIGSAATPYWKFADHQWDCIGDNGQGSTNSNVDRDLFGWGTSGYDHGAVCYQPWSTSNDDTDYYAYGSDTYNLYDQTGQADWGHNAISNGGNTENNGWRTLTKDEWVYLFNTRSTTSGIRYAKAKVNNVNGVILLPDDWNSNYYTLNSTNSANAYFTSNTITASQWNTLEQRGAVFLPVAGYRDGTSVDGSYSYYWSSSCRGNTDASCIGFGGNVLSLTWSIGRRKGHSVRLVVPAENYCYGINATSNPSEGGMVSGGGAYAWGTECTLTATPSDGYTFISWTENSIVVSTDATYTFTVSRERNLVANFVPHISQGAVSGHAFKVNANGDQVLFSQGNLQYIGSASTPYWKFADHQWDNLGNTGQSGQGSYNYYADRDLFGWGTSGYNHGAVCYQPWSTSTTNSDYYAYGNENYNLFDQTGQADWGYNAISNGGNTENSGWRTLTKDEWAYLFNTRTTSSGIRYAKAQVNGVYGVILLPDDWSTSYYTLNNTNTSYSNYSSNMITASQWNTLEQHGAVFLPVAGYRSGTSINVSYNSTYYNGNYWSASYYDSNSAYTVNFNTSNLSYSSYHNRNYGQSVRLVAPRENFSFVINAMPNPTEGGTVSGGGTYAVGTSCTLTATPSAGYTFVSWIENGAIVSTSSTYNFTVYNNRNLIANFAQEGNITFADANVKARCVANWDSNSDGELSYAEAAAVASLGNVFKNKTNIQSFTELEYFISLGTIGEQAFYGCTALTQVTIPENVTSIGSQAFWNCPALQTVNFNARNCASMKTTYNSNTYPMFSSNTNGAAPAITKVVIGSNVTRIPDYAFYNASNINNRLVVRSSVTEIGNYAFYGCTSMPQMLIQGNGLQTIGNYAFYNCSALSTALNIPNSVTSVGQYAFYGCSQLPSVTIGESVAIIGGYAFWNCPNLATVNFNATNCTTMVTGLEDSVFRGAGGTTPIVTLNIGSNVTNIPDYAFRNSPGITHAIVIPNATTNIGTRAFDGVQSSELTIGTRVTTIGGYAFWNCPNLATVHFNATNCTQMHSAQNSNDNYTYSVFSSGNGNYGETPIVTLTIGENVTRIPNFAFKNSPNATGNLLLPSGLNYIGKHAFKDCSGFDGNLAIPNSVTTIGDNAFYGCSSFTGSLVIPNSVTSIGGSAFQNCSGFTGSLVIPNSVTTISENTFESCSGFTGSLVIPNSVTTIGNSAFRQCTGFTGSPVIPNSVTTIGYNAFYNCSGFTGSLVIPNSVTIIGSRAFYNCSGFTGSLTIGNSVTTIGGSAFYNCIGFTGSLVIPNSVTTIYEDAFSGCSGFTGSLVIPNSVTTIGGYAFNGCNGFDGILVIPNSVTTINQYVFQNCNGFTGSLVIPNSVTTIDNYAFNGCSGFDGNLVIPNSVTTINQYAFQNCSGITALIVERQNPATAQSNSFEGMTYSIPFHVPYGKISTYQSATGWSNFTNRKEQYQFEEFDNDLWSDDINWYQGMLPSASDVVCLISNCHLDVDANVLHLYVQNPSDVFTINSGKTITGGINPRLSSQLVIAEGGQLVNYYSNGSGTVQRQISGYGTGNDGWYTIAAPIYGGMPVSGLTTGTYDLYSYDEPTAMWLNEKVDGNFDKFNPAQGYLYANQSPKTVNLAGQLNASNAEISIPVTYTAGDLAGFNLVGNPYTNNINIGDVKINGTAQTAFYRAEGGSSLLAYVAADNEPIKPGDGFFVKATEDGTLTFGSAQTRGESQQDGYVRLVLRKNGSETVVADRAYLRMNEGERLEKMSTSTAHSLLYFENGGSRYAVANNEAVNGVMPLFIEKANGTYSIEATLLNAECGYLHLVDNMTGKDIDLLETPVYSFEAKTTDYASRFNLVFSSEGDGPSTGSGTFAYIDADGNLIINGPSTGSSTGSEYHSGTSILQVVDVTGRIMMQEENATRVSTSGMKPGVYVLRLINGDSVKTQKIVIK